MRAVIIAQAKPPSAAVFPADLCPRSKDDRTAKVEPAIVQINTGHGVQFRKERGTLKSGYVVGLPHAEPRLALLTDRKPNRMTEGAILVPQIIPEVDLAGRIGPPFQNLSCREGQPRRRLRPPPALSAPFAALSAVRSAV